jgi:hypothetical protein
VTENPSASIPTLVGDLVATSQRVGEHAARRSKIAILPAFCGAWRRWKSRSVFPTSLARPGRAEAASDTR